MAQTYNPMEALKGAIPPQGTQYIGGITEDELAEGLARYRNQQYQERMYKQMYEDPTTSGPFKQMGMDVMMGGAGFGAGKAAKAVSARRFAGEALNPGQTLGAGLGGAAEEARKWVFPKGVNPALKPTYNKLANYWSGQTSKIGVEKARAGFQKGWKKAQDDFAAAPAPAVDDASSMGFGAGGKPTMGQKAASLGKGAVRLVAEADPLTRTARRVVDPLSPHAGQLGKIPWVGDFVTAARQAKAGESKAGLMTALYGLGDVAYDLTMAPLILSQIAPNIDEGVLREIYKEFRDQSSPDYDIKPTRGSDLYARRGLEEGEQGPELPADFNELAAG